MNQQCKVCGEPAAGFHFGAFTCEGCKSFFGRSYNNMNSIADCKNGGECVINKKNRTACKACRLKKCFFVGMSKSGSRYGRRSNWFKIHCLLQEQQQQQQQQLEQQLHEQQQQQQQQQHQHQHQHQQQQQQHHYQPALLGRQHQLPHQQQQQQQQQQHQQQQQQQRKPTNSPIHGIHAGQRKDEAMLLGLDDYKNSSSPSISSPESHNSDSSVEVSERRAAFAGHPSFRPPHPHLPLQQPMNDLSVLSKEMIGLPLSFPLGGMSLLSSTAFLPPPSLTMFSPYHIYAAPHTAPHPLVANHTSSLLRRSPAIDEAGAASVATAAASVAAASRVSVSPDDNDARERNNNNEPFYLDALFKGRRRSSPETSPTPRREHSPCDDDGLSDCSPEREVECLPPQDDPMDLSMKPAATPTSDQDEEMDVDVPPPKKPMDLTTRSKEVDEIACANTVAPS